MNPHGHLIAPRSPSLHCALLRGLYVLQFGQSLMTCVHRSIVRGSPKPLCAPCAHPPSRSLVTPMVFLSQWCCLFQRSRHGLVLTNQSHLLLFHIKANSSQCSGAPGSGQGLLSACVSCCSLQHTPRSRRNDVRTVPPGVGRSPVFVLTSQILKDGCAC